METINIAQGQLFIMALFGRKGKKEESPEAPAEAAKQETEEVKPEEKNNQKTEETEPEDKPSASPKPVKTDFFEDSKNTDQITNMTMKLVKIINELENVKKKIDENTSKTITEVKNVYEDVENLSDLVKEVPADTLRELKSIKRNLPMVYSDIKQAVGEHVTASVVSVIDTNILKTISAAESINSKDLLDNIKKNHVCSKNTLYIHLDKLEQQGMVLKKRQVHEVYYSVADKVKNELKTSEKKESGQVSSGKQDTNPPAEANSQPQAPPEPAKQEESKKEKTEEKTEAKEAPKEEKPEEKKDEKPVVHAS